MFDSFEKSKTFFVHVTRNRKNSQWYFKNVRFVRKIENLFYFVNNYEIIKTSTTDTA